MRTWFQTPNSFGNLKVGVIGPGDSPVGPTDQRSKIETFNIAPTWTRIISPSVLFTLALLCGWTNTTTIPVQILSQILAHPSPLASCAPSRRGSTLVQIPSPGPENDDHNPPRIQSRNLLDVAIGEDVLFHGTRYNWSLRVSVINLMNKVALYNFLSTFSGTHYVTPHTITAEIGFHF